MLYFKLPSKAKHSQFWGLNCPVCWKLEQLRGCEETGLGDPLLPDVLI